jgi:hypothetical protein
VYLLGLGEGSRAVSELLTVRELTEQTPAPFAYRPTGVLMDSAADDVRPYFATGDTIPSDYPIIRSGLDRLFPGGQSTVMSGSLAWTPLNNIPNRVGFLSSANDPYIPDGSNDAATARLAERAPSDLWLWESVEPAHVLSNADPELAKSIADFLVGGLDAVDPAFIND